MVFRRVGSPTTNQTFISVYGRYTQGHFRWAIDSTKSKLFLGLLPTPSSTQKPTSHSVPTPCQPPSSPHQVDNHTSSVSF